MWQRFTERARRVVFFAQDEAGKLGTNEVGPEHLLLGMLREDDSVAARVLASMSISLVTLGDILRRLTPSGPGIRLGEMQLSAESKAAIDFAYDEAQRLNNTYIGTEHLLLGLLRRNGGIAAQALSEAGVQLAPTRAFVAALQTTSSIEAAKEAALDASGATGTREDPERRFTETARELIELAKREAVAFGENFYSTEHLLLAIVQNPSALVMELLERLGVSLIAIDADLRRQVGRGDGKRNTVITPTPRVKRVFSLAQDAARKLTDSVVGPEHLLMGLVNEAEGLAGRILLKRGVSLDKLLDAYVELRLAAMEGEIENESRLEAQLVALRQRLAELPNAEAFEAPPASSYGDTPAPLFGDLGVASPTYGRAQIEVAHDAAAFRLLIAVFLAKDAYGYRNLTDGDQTVFLLPAGTALKRLVSPAESEDIFEEGYYVRVLEGDYAGYAGWIFKDAFVRTGLDYAEFPPTI